jgi:hypothetical protein
MVPLWPAQGLLVMDDDAHGRQPRVPPPCHARIVRNKTDTFRIC